MSHPLRTDKRISYSFNVGYLQTATKVPSI